MEMRRTLWCVRLLLLVTSALTVPTVPAQADPSCPDGAICFWTGTDFTGDKAVLADPQPRGCMSLPELVSSARNLSGRSVTLYASSDCSGEVITFGPCEESSGFSSKAAYAVS
jgi:hypothetical protein